MDSAALFGDFHSNSGQLKHGAVAKNRGTGGDEKNVSDLGRAQLRRVLQKIGRRVWQRHDKDQKCHWKGSRSHPVASEKEKTARCYKANKCEGHQGQIIV